MFRAGSKESLMARRSRRQFLEDSMLATAAAVATSSPAPLFGGADFVSRAPNEKLGVAVVGLRGRGGSHIGALAGRKDTEVLYVCDVDADVGEKRRQEVAKRQGRAPRFERDLRRVLEDRRVDLVTIATPNHQHALQAIWAMQAGKDVYLEKPVSHNVSEGRRVVEAARKYERICQSGTQCRSNPGMIAAMRFLAEGGLGSVRLARGLCCVRRTPMGPRGEYPIPAQVDYDLWLGPAPLAALTRRQFHYDWHWQWAYGNGELGNQGVHQLDLARWALGQDRHCQSVLSYGGRFGPPDAGDAANTQVVLFDFGERSLVFEVRGVPAEDTRGMRVGVIVDCADGFLVLSSYDSSTAFDRDGRQIRHFQGSADHFANFLKAVRNRRACDLTADIEQGHLSSTLCHIANISYRLGEAAPQDELRDAVARFPTADDSLATLDRTLAHLASNQLEPEADSVRLGAVLDFDPVSETFPGNDAANTLLSREYRAPFTLPIAADI
jgi:predicted dehydrogenase